LDITPFSPCWKTFAACRVFGWQMSYVLGLERGVIQTVNLVVERMVDSWFHLHDLENVGFKVLMWNSNRFVWEYV
jgi:hypothetical protein